MFPPGKTVRDARWVKGFGISAQGFRATLRFFDLRLIVLDEALRRCPGPRFYRYRHHLSFPQLRKDENARLRG